MNEKRKLVRFNLKIPAKIKVLPLDQISEEEEIINLLTSNICSGGAFFHTPEPLPEGTRVKIDLILPLDKVEKLRDDYKQVYIKITGRVLRSESKGMAIGFNEDYQIRPLKTGPLTQHSGGNHAFETHNLNQTASQN